MPRPNHDQEILDCFAQKNTALTATQLQNILGLNKSTIYRRLEALEEKKALKALIASNGKTLYELYNHDHHHHLLCEKCQHLEDITLVSEAALLTEVMSVSRFRVKSHMIEFQGICQNCQ